MIRRIVEVVDSAATVKWANGCVEIALTREGAVHRLQPSELDTLILGDPVSTVSVPALSSLASAGVPVVVSSGNRMPAAMLLPLESNYIQTERFIAQASASQPLLKRMWQTVTAAKLRNQGRLLLQRRGDDFGLLALSRKVKSGDSDNLEARGARIYWRELFGKPFARCREASDGNMMFNYGYAILRSVTARAICGAGLHPTLGINHHNRYNAFCLADDLMEPFRRVVDAAVLRLMPDNCELEELSREMRRELISAVQGRVAMDSGDWRIADVLEHIAAKTAESFCTKKNKLDAGDFGK